LFLGLAAASPALAADAPLAIPKYKIVTKHKPAGAAMPGPYAGQVTRVYAENSVDAATMRPNQAVVAEMIRRGMLALTGGKDPRDSWARFFAADDVVGIKINASGAPHICSSPEIVGEIARNLVAVGVRPENIWLHERFMNQVRTVPYAQFVPAGVHVVTADTAMGYDPFTYVEVSFFGEDDTRSNMVRLTADKFTKVINVPNMKDHSASGVTGCLKNIAYGEFSNVARSHTRTDTHTYSFIGTLATVEPLRSRTVLHIMDGLRCVWHAGPFSTNPRFRFSAKQIMFGTDPVAMDRLLIDVIDDKRRSEGAISVWERSPKYLEGDARKFNQDPNINRYTREPGHIEYAAKLGLGVYDKARIKVNEIRL
jgi:hypothetical protein